MFDTKTIAEFDSELYAAMDAERRRQESHIELIASENFASPRVMEAQGSALTNKYAEGYPGRRYYGGCAHVDEVERLAIARASQLFAAPFVNVQPHSGSQANQTVFHAVLKPGDAILGMDISQGGHLTHGAAVNLSGKLFRAAGYGLHPDTGDIDYDAMEKIAHETRPKLIICGASAFSRKIDFARFRAAADSVGAYLLADIAHYAGLVAAGLYPNPLPHAHFTTTTTHKTLRGPRGGMVMWSDEQFSKKINGALFPGLQGGPLLPAIAGKAVAFLEAMEPEFREYQKRVLENAQTLAAALMKGGVSIVSGGTDSHLMLADLRGTGITGKAAEDALDAAHITLNKNGVPDDPQPPTVTSGVRIGTPAATTRGFGEAEFLRVAEWILRVLRASENRGEIAAVAAEVRELCAQYPIYTPS